MKHLIAVIFVILTALGLVAYNKIQLNTALDEIRQEMRKLGASQAISSLTELTSLSHNDVFPITDTANATTKKVKWGTATTSMKAILDAAYNSTYSPIFSTSAGLAGLLSDETGTGKSVFASSSVMESVRLLTPTFNISGTEAKANILYFSDANGTLAQLPAPSGSGYFLAGSSTMDRPVWDNSVLSTLVTASTTFLATTTISGDSLTSRAFVINRIPYAFPSANNVGVLKNDGAGTLTWGNPVRYSATMAAVTANNGFATSTNSIIIPAGVLSASSTITISGNMSSSQGSNSSGSFFLRDTSGTTFVEIPLPNTVAAGGYNNNFDATIFNNGSLTAQKSFYKYFAFNSNSANTSAIGSSLGSSAFNTANTLTLVAVMYSPAAFNYTLNHVVVTIDP